MKSRFLNFLLSMNFVFLFLNDLLIFFLVFSIELLVLFIIFNFSNFLNETL